MVRENTSEIGCIIIRDKEAIRAVQAEQARNSDTSAASTAVKMLLKYNMLRSMPVSASTNDAEGSLPVPAVPST